MKSATYHAAIAAGRIRIHLIDRGIAAYLLRELAAGIETLRQRFRFRHYTADSRRAHTPPDPQKRRDDEATAMQECRPSRRRPPSRPKRTAGSSSTRRRW